MREKQSFGLTFSIYFSAFCLISLFTLARFAVVGQDFHTAAEERREFAGNRNF